VELINVENNSDVTEILQNYLGVGKQIKLPKGTFYISKTVSVASGARLEGSGDVQTKLCLADSVNDNMFTNLTHRKGNKDITFINLFFDGNWKKQFKPEEEKRLSFCNIVYFANTKSLSFLNIKAENCFQTVLHFNNCVSVKIKKL